MKIGVVVFPGSNCDHDALHAFKRSPSPDRPISSGTNRRTSPAFDAVILPGGFSYGDYLRTGAIARFSPVMNAIERFARSGGLVLGICNGFQILCEAGLAARRADAQSSGLRFICRHVHIRVETTATPFTSARRRSAKCCAFRSRMPRATTSAIAGTLAELEAQ